MRPKLKAAYTLMSLRAAELSEREKPTPTVFLPRDQPVLVNVIIVIIYTLAETVVGKIPSCSSMPVIFEL